MRHDKLKWNCATFEYEQNDKEKGEWFNKNINMFMMGYSNKQETAYYKWLLLDWKILHREVHKILKDNNINKLNIKKSWYYRKNNKHSKNSSFLRIPIELLKDSIIKQG